MSQLTPDSTLLDKHNKGEVMSKIRKLVRDNKVGVIISKLFDMEGWYTSHNNLELLFLPELIELIESDDYCNRSLIRYGLCQELLQKLGYDLRDSDNLTVIWLPITTQFKVECRSNVLRDYYEEVIVINDGNWITA